MKKMRAVLVSLANVAIIASSIGLSTAMASTQLNGVTVTSVRANDKDNPEFPGWYGLVCVDATGQTDTSNFAGCGGSTVYCVTEGEAFGRGMMAVAMSAMMSGRKVNIRSTANQCDMVEMH